MQQTPSAARLGLLTSWKEIANFLGKGVRTVQRWEATLGLPVIRPLDNRSGIVMARPSDLEAWVLNGRRKSHDKANGTQPMDATARATLSECVQQLHRCHVEAKALCDQVSVARGVLQHEIDRLRLLCQEWQAMRTYLAADERPAATSSPAQMN